MRHRPPRLDVPGEEGRARRLPMCSHRGRSAAPPRGVAGCAAPATSAAGSREAALGRAAAARPKSSSAMGGHLHLPQVEVPVDVVRAGHAEASNSASSAARARRPADGAHRAGRSASVHGLGRRGPSGRSAARDRDAYTAAPSGPWPALTRAASRSARGQASWTPGRTPGPAAYGCSPRRRQCQPPARAPGFGRGERALQHHVRVLAVLQQPEQLHDQGRGALDLDDQRGVGLLPGEHPAAHRPAQRERGLGHRTMTGQAQRGTGRAIAGDERGEQRGPAVGVPGAGRRSTSGTW